VFKVRVSIRVRVLGLVFCVRVRVRVKGRTLVTVPLLGLPATAEALRYMARTEQRRTYLPLYLPDRSRYSC